MVIEFRLSYHSELDASTWDVETNAGIILHRFGTYYKSGTHLARAFYGYLAA